MTDEKTSAENLVKVYIDQIEILLPLGMQIFNVLQHKKSLEEKDFLIYAFLRKTIRLLSAIRFLVYHDLVEEAQLLSRVLIETYINLAFFLELAQKDLGEATYRIIDSMMLEKKKALEATNYRFGNHTIDKQRWIEIEEKIRNRYSETEFKNLKRFGFSGQSLKARAQKTGNDHYYDLVYRLYSKHAHGNDLNEQLQEVLMPEYVPRYSRSRMLALLQATFNSAMNIIYECDKWLGMPVPWPVPESE
jgi:hypothetical protein